MRATDIEESLSRCRATGVPRTPATPASPAIATIGSWRACVACSEPSRSDAKTGAGATSTAPARTPQPRSGAGSVATPVLTAPAYLRRSDGALGQHGPQESPGEPPRPPRALPRRAARDDLPARLA